MTDPIPAEVLAAMHTVNAYTAQRDRSAKAASAVAATPSPATAKVSDEVYQRMTSAQRLDYARQFRQDQFSATQRSPR